MVIYVIATPPHPPPLCVDGGCGSSRGSFGVDCGLGFPRGDSGASRQSSTDAVIEFLGDCFGQALGANFARAANGECGLGRFAAAGEEDRQRLIATERFASPCRLSVHQGMDERAGLVVDFQEIFCRIAAGKTARWVVAVISVVCRCSRPVSGSVVLTSPRHFLI